MTFENDPEAVLSILVHAPSKVGKSTLSWTTPGPTLILDAEGGTKFLRARKVYWNPLEGPPPEYNGSWDVCITKIHSWQTIELADAYLRQHAHGFVSLVLDSITEMQRVCKANLRGTEQMRIQDWGALLTQMDMKIRGFRDLTLITESPIKCVVLIAETKKVDGKWRPFMQGQIGTSLPYWVDICGYLFVDNELDENGQPTAQVRKLLISPHDDYETGERVQGRLPSIVDKPNILDMINTIYAEE